MFPLSYWRLFIYMGLLVNSDLALHNLTIIFGFKLLIFMFVVTIMIYLIIVIYL